MQENTAENIATLPTRDPRVVRLLSVGALKIKKSQRPVDEDRALRISMEWDWNKAEAITVCERDGEPGVYDVVEGQNRTLALQLIDPAALIWCVVLEPMGAPQQARTALSIDAGRKRISAIDKWAMRLTEGDPFVVAAAGVLRERSISISKTYGARQTKAAASIDSIVRGRGAQTPEYGAHLLSSTLDVIFDAWPSDPHGIDERMTGEIISAVATIMAEGHPRGRVVKALSGKRRNPEGWLSPNGGGESRRKRIETTLRAEVSQ